MQLWEYNLRHLRAAVEVARLGSINAAADAVNLTQPAITQALTKVEAQLGLPLFERRHDGMKTTEAASLFIPRVETALSLIGSNRITTAQMRALLALGQAGAYAGASAATGLSQPSLHRAISDLGLVLKRPMVERRGKGLAFTEAGRKCLRAFRLARSELLAALSEIDGLKGRETGRITIGAMPLSRARILPAAIAANYRVRPDVAIEVLEGSWQELVEPLRDGEVDMMVGALRDPHPGDDLTQQALFVDRPVVVARKGHPLVGQFTVDADRETMARMSAFPWTVAAPDTPLRGQWEQMFLQFQLTPPVVPIECGSVMMIRQILIESDFLTLLSPAQVAVELEAGWLEIICPAPAEIVRNIGITTRAGWRPTAKQAAFLALLVATANNDIPEKL